MKISTPISTLLKKGLLANRYILIPLAIFLLAELFANLVLQHFLSMGFRPILHEQYRPSYGTLVTSWDAGYYRILAEGWLNPTLPHDSYLDEWKIRAFYPLFPLIAKLVMTVTTLPFGVVGPVLSAIFTLAACSVLYRWILEHNKSHWAASIASASLLLVPSVFIFQTGYTEGLSLLLIICFLRLVAARKFLWAILPVLLLGLTRNIVLPLFLITLLWAFLQVSQRLKGQSWAEKKVTLRAIPKLRFLLLVQALIISGLAWPLIVAYISGNPREYFDIYHRWTPIKGFGLWFFHSPFTEVQWYSHGTWIIVVPVLIVALYLAFNRHSGYPLILKISPLVMALYVFSVTNLGGSEWRYLSMGLFLYPFSQVPATRFGRIIYFGLLSLVVIAALAAIAWWCSSRMLSPIGSTYVPSP